MISYELAKELKEAGYPQPSLYGVPVILEDGVYYPTLEELIEACAEGFNYMKFKNGTYRAQGGDLGMEELEATSPSEAVAKLWLALNKK